MNMTKTSIFTLCLTAVFSLGSAQAQIIVSTLANAPSNTAVLSNGTEIQSVQARYTAAGDFRAVTQSFQWNTTNQLDAIGVKISSAQTANGTWTWSANATQAYTLIISSAQNRGATNMSPMSVVAQYNFTLAAAQVNSTQWLNLDLTTNLALTNGNWYVWQINPVAVDAKRLFLENNNTNNVGNYRQLAQGTIGLPGGTGGNGTLNGIFSNQDNLGLNGDSVVAGDMTFYAVPEPTSAALLIVAAGLVAGAVRHRRRPQ